MAKTMIPSEVTPITAGQIGKIQDNLTAALRKSRLLSEPVQQVLEHHGDAVVAEMVAAIRKRVEAVSDMIVRRVRVDRTRTSQEVFDATGRRQYTTAGVVETMPGSGDDAEEVEVYFFRLGRFVSDDKLEEEFALRGFEAADPYSLAAVNEDDASFTDDHPNSTHWKDAEGKWCYAAFGRWYDGRYVDVDRYADGWSDDWWFASLRK
jgi:hypothetical protein